VFRIRLVSLAAIAIVSGTLTAMSPVTARVLFLVLCICSAAYVAQTRLRGRAAIRVLLTLCLFWVAASRTSSLVSNNADGIPQDARTFDGRAVSPAVLTSAGGMSFDLRVDTCDGVALPRAVDIEVYMPDRRTGPVMGQRVYLTGTVSPERLAQNPGERRYGVTIPTAVLGRELRLAPPDSLAARWGAKTRDVRDRIERSARSLFSYQAYGLLDELLLNRRLFASGERQLFAATGTSHLLSISGLHLTLFYAIVLFCIGLMRRNDAARLPLPALAATFLYLAFIDFPPSANRSFVMLCVVAASRALGRHTGNLERLAWAALTLAVVDPLSFFDIGLQLSFASVAGIVFIGEPLLQHVIRWRFLPKALASTLCTTIGASLPAAILAIPVFHSVSLVALLANITAIPVVALLLPAFLGWTLISWVAAPVGVLLAPLFNAAAAVLFWWLQLCSHLPGAARNVAPPSSATLTAAGILFFGIALLADNRARIRTWRHPGIVIGSLAAVTTALWVFSAPRTDVRITFPVVAQGSAILVRCSSIGDWLYLSGTDAASARRAVRTVAAMGVSSPDGVILISEQVDRPEQVDAILSTIAPDSLYVYPSMDSKTFDAGRTRVEGMPADRFLKLQTAEIELCVTPTSPDTSTFSLVTPVIAGSTDGMLEQATTAQMRFAYDSALRTLRIMTGSGTASYALDAVGCVSICARGSRSWVARDTAP
jgi:ComEC/Rec2-related protein